MKKILIFFNIIFAVFLANTLYAQDGKSELGLNIANAYTIDALPLSSEALTFDICIEDILEDYSTDSEKEKSSSEKTLLKNTSFILQIYSYNNYNKILPTKSFCPLRGSLFIFNCVLRL
jgi:hypothetical protein